MCPGCANALRVRGRARDPAPIAKKGAPGCRRYFCFKGPEFHKRSTGSVYFILNKKRKGLRLPSPLPALSGPGCCCLQRGCRDGNDHQPNSKWISSPEGYPWGRPFGCLGSPSPLPAPQL